MIRETVVEEITKVTLEKSKHLSALDKIMLDSDLVFSLGETGIKVFITELMFEFNKAYPEALVEILQNPDFSEVIEELTEELEEEVKDLKQKNRELYSVTDGLINMINAYEGD